MTSLYELSLPAIIRGMQNTMAFLQKGVNHAKANSIDPADYLSGRLHPDMANLPFQVYRLTDAAKFIPSRINPAIEPLVFSDVEQTFPELIGRIQKTIAYLEGIKPEDLEGKEDNEVVIKTKGPDGEPREIKLLARSYVLNFALPNFWFHVTTAYGILRMKGVDVGKMDFLNGVSLTKVENVSQ